MDKTTGNMLRTDDGFSGLMQRMIELQEQEIKRLNTEVKRCDNRADDLSTQGRYYDQYLHRYNLVGGIITGVLDLVHRSDVMSLEKLENISEMVQRPQLKPASQVNRANQVAQDSGNAGTDPDNLQARGARTPRTPVQQ